MDFALLQITNAATGQPLLAMDTAQYQAKAELMNKRERLTFLEQKPPATLGGSTSSSGGSPSQPPCTYEDSLLFLMAAQDECYQYFGKLMDKADKKGGGVDDDDDDDEMDGVGAIVGRRGVGESVPVSEWSLEEEPARKKNKKL